MRSTTFMISHIIKTKIYILGFFLIVFSCSNNSNETVIFHFSKEEMKELNKTGKVVQTDNQGIERVFIYDDKFDKVAKKTKSDPNKVKEKQEAEKKRLAEKKAAEKERLAKKKAAEEKRLARKKAAEEKAAQEKQLAEKKAAEEAKRLAEEKAAEEAKRLAE